MVSCEELFPTRKEKKNFSGLPQKGSFLQKAKSRSRKALVQLRTSFSDEEQPTNF